jgi:hypothetical protein
MKIILAILGSVIVTGDGGFYIYGILRGRVHPHPFSWGLWTLLGGIAFAAGLAGGAGIGLLPVGLLMAENCIVLFLALRSANSDEDRSHPFLLVFAAIGVIGWLLSNDPAVAAIGAVTADLMAALPTVKQTWRNPASELAWTWSIDAIAMAMSLLALQRLDIASALFPAYLACIDLTIAVIALTRRRALTKASQFR